MNTILYHARHQLSALYDHVPNMVVMFQRMCDIIPDSKVHGTYMGSIWGRQGPGGPHVGPMDFAIWNVIQI